MSNETTYDTKFTERKLFSYEERKEILKSTGGICACCGKKLTTKTMTVEHIIPIYRGGTNDADNLTALCYTCNQDKGNLLFLPRSFYSALAGTPRLTQMDNMVRNWFSNNRERYDIERYPLIAPKHNCMIHAANKMKKLKYNRQLIITWSLISSENYEEIEAISDTNLKSIRDFLERVRPEATECDRHLYPHHETYKPVTFYALHKLSNHKLLAVLALRYDKDQKDMAIYVIWTDMTKHSIPMITSNFINCAFDAICNIGNEEIHDYIIFSQYSEAFQYFRKGCEYHAIWQKAEEFQFYDTICKKPLYAMIVYTNRNQLPISISKYVTIPRWLKAVDIDPIEGLH